MTVINSAKIKNYDEVIFSIKSGTFERLRAFPREGAQAACRAEHGAAKTRSRVGPPRELRPAVLAKITRRQRGMCRCFRDG